MPFFYQSKIIPTYEFCFFKHAPFNSYKCPGLDNEKHDHLDLSLALPLTKKFLKNYPYHHHLNDTNCTHIHSNLKFTKFKGSKMCWLKLWNQKARGWRPGSPTCLPGGLGILQSFSGSQVEFIIKWIHWMTTRTSKAYWGFATCPVLQQILWYVTQFPLQDWKTYFFTTPHCCAQSAAGYQPCPGIALGWRGPSSPRSCSFSESSLHPVQRM